MISNRLAATSDPTKTVAGQMIGRPTMIRFSRNEQMVFIHQAQVRNIVAEGDYVVVTAGDPETSPKQGTYTTSTNLLMVAQVR